MKWRYLILGSVVLSLGCDSRPTDLTPTDIVRDEAAPVQTGSLLYFLDETEEQDAADILRRFETAIDYTYTNPTAQTIYVVKCRSVAFRLEKRGDTGNWIKVWAGSDYARCLGEPTVVHAGAIFTGTLAVFGYERNTQEWPQFSGPDMEGIFRLVLLGAVYLADPSDYPDGIEVETDYLYSNRFELRLR